MKRLTENEIRFIKETNVTPTVVFCEEWRRTPYSGLAEATERGINEYSVDIQAIMDKCSEYDGISLEYMATYLLYTFFTQEQLESLSFDELLSWLKDFKYFCGFRKWNEYWVEIVVNEALEVYAGTREFFDDEDGEVWHREVEK